MSIINRPCGVAEDEDPTDAEYELMDRIELVLAAHPRETFSPSQIARKVRTETQDARNALSWMARHQTVLESGNGAWTRYRHRQPGQMNERYRPAPL